MPKLSSRFYTIDARRPVLPRRAVQRPVLRVTAALLVAAALACLPAPASGRLAVQTLKPVLALPPHIAGQFREPAGFVALKAGGYLVFDRRGHAVYRVSADRASVTRVVSVGVEAGRLLQPVGFSVGDDDSFVVADAPFGRQRVQLFALEGNPLRQWVLPGQVHPFVAVGSLVLNGAGSLQYDGAHVYVNEPEHGALITSYAIDGTPERTIGRLRDTPYAASDPELHHAFNTGLPLVDPHGGFYFVFEAGEPRFRRYDAGGRLVFERVIQGRELDALLAAQPTSWKARAAGSRELAAVPPVVRTAAVTPEGDLWVSFSVPYTYVYDRDGEKTAVLRFDAAGILAPTSLSFTADRRVLVTPGCYIFDRPR